MDLKEGDLVRIKRVSELDVNHSGYGSLNVELVDELQDYKARVVRVEPGGGVKIYVYSYKGDDKDFNVSPEHINLILKKDFELPEKLFQI